MGLMFLETAYFLLGYIADVLFNFWFLLLAVAAPLLVFRMKPAERVRLRFGRLALAIGLTYVLLVVATVTASSLSWRHYEACYASKTELRYMSPERNEACQHHLGMPTDAGMVFVVMFGVVPAAGYVGFWELLWRFRYRREIGTLGADFRGRWYSNLAIGFFLINFLLVLYLAGHWFGVIGGLVLLAV